jgi:RimJ/RimL family protein N-acetyltransferase
MTDSVSLRTKRLILRRWMAKDIEPFAAINADPEVMRHFPSTLTLDQTKSFVAAVEAHFENEGFGLWATDLVETGEMIGFVGLSIPRFEAHFTPCVEIGWRLAHKHWGCGYAPEAAHEVLNDAFNRLKLEEIVSLTATVNSNSMRVMEKIGMKRDPADDFDHPRLDEGHHLRRHVLYRINASDFATAMKPAVQAL